MILTSTDKIEMVTASAASVDYYTSYLDASNANPPVVQGDTAGNKTGAGISNATTDIVSAPASGDLRKVKYINIRNKSTTVATDVTVQVDVSGTNVELYKCNLDVGEQLTWIEGVGWFEYPAAAKLDKMLRVTSDVDNATTSFADVTGLTVPVLSGKHYLFLCQLFHIENASTTGARFGINGPSMTSMRVGGFSGFAGSLTAATFNMHTADVAAVDTSILGVTTSSAATPQVVPAVMFGWINPSADGTFAIRSQSEVAVAAGVKVKAGSWLHIREADN